MKKQTMAAKAFQKKQAQESNGNEEEEEKTKLIEDGRGFFCSELVAKAYKCCGIMQPTDEASSNFWPADLSSNKNSLRLV